MNTGYIIEVTDNYVKFIGLIPLPIFCKLSDLYGKSGYKWLTSDMEGNLTLTKKSGKEDDEKSL